MATPTLIRARPRRGAAAVLAMLFLVLFTTLATAMYSMATLNVQGADTLADADRAHAAAESGLRWINWRFAKMPRPKTTTGTISPAVATTLWPQIRAALTTEFNAMLTSSERTLTWVNNVLTSQPISTGSGQGTFVLKLQQHPLYAGDPLDARYVRVTSVGTYGGATRSVSMDFKIDKKIKFAIVGRVPIQIGRNTLVEGPIAMTTPGKYPPLLQLSDFRHLTPGLRSKIDDFNAFLKENHKGYDNRVSVHNPDEFTKATQAGYADVNGDSFVDEYDLFVAEFDRDGDKAITASEFTNPSTGKLYDPDLWKAMDSLGGPLFAGDPIRSGYMDNRIDNFDAYTKIRGEVSIASTAEAWKNHLGAGGSIQNMIQGPIQTSDGAFDTAVKFGVDGDDLFDLGPQDFDTTAFKNKTGPANGATTTTKGNATTPITLENRTLSAADSNLMQVTAKGQTSFNVGDVVLKSDFDAANAPLASTKKATGTNLTVAPVNERTPYGSGSYQATYKRPVFKNMKFKNVRIPKGLNALFDNCTFEGVTFVELTTNVTNNSNQTTTSPSDGMTWAQKMKSGGFNKDTALDSTNSYGAERGNNLRFNNCTLKGPVTSDVPTAYTHFANSMEFTGATRFDNVADQTATILCPQTNIEMGSFTDPATAPSTLVGVVVAGNLDVRGTSVVDGSIIITGDGAGNTTQGWFGPRDDQTETATPMPEGGYGRLNIRYNPHRALPDGINIAVDITPDTNTYREGK